MKTEVIIAARCEVPENLTRTVEQASKSADVCVVFDGDEPGNECPDAVRDAARVLRVDGRPSGCGYARNAGIESSEADLIVILDGHISLPRNWKQGFERQTWEASELAMSAVPGHGKHVGTAPE